MQTRKTFNLFKDEDGNIPMQPDVASQMVSKLFNEARLRRKSKSTKSSTWKPYFENLINQHGQGSVWAVLDWYIIHMDEPGLPRAYSAKAFSASFPQLVAKMSCAPDAVIVSKEVSKLCSHFKHLTWPSGTDTTFPQMAQKSYENYIQFWARVESGFAAVKKDKTYTRMLRLWEHLRARYMPEPIQFIRQWVHLVHSMVSVFPDWNGNIMNYVWELENPKFHIRAIGWCRAYSGEGSTWFDFVKTIKEFK